jgi:hypothetical protein
VDACGRVDVKPATINVGVSIKHAIVYVAVSIRGAIIINPGCEDCDDESFN